MRLVKNARSIALRSFSMWSLYIGTAILVVPEILWFVFEVETNPYSWGYVAILVQVVGIVGRLIDQGITND